VQCLNFIIAIVHLLNYKNTRSFTTGYVLKINLLPVVAIVAIVAIYKSLSQKNKSN
jgi:hypothetical protein